MTDTDQLSEKESFAIIESMILRAKNNFSESGTLFIFWGILIVVCSFIHFALIYFYNSPNGQYVWGLTWIASIVQIIYLRRKARLRKVKTYSGDIIKYIWLSFVICLFLLLFILIQQKANSSVNPAILIMYGIPTFLSGIILKFRSLVLGGVCCWLFAVACIFTPWQFQLLYIAAAGIVAWIIPGVYFRQKFLKEDISYGR